MGVFNNDLELVGGLGYVLRCVYWEKNFKEVYV